MTRVEFSNELTAGLESLARLMLDENIHPQVAERMLVHAIVTEALRRTDQNKCKAAKLTGLHRNTILKIVPHTAA